MATLFGPTPVCNRGFFTAEKRAGLAAGHFEHGRAVGLGEIASFASNLAQTAADRPRSPRLTRM
eukprot:10398499-Lingulodinium_polyedra.AAC.1